MPSIHDVKLVLLALVLGIIIAVCFVDFNDPEIGNWDALREVSLSQAHGAKAAMLALGAAAALFIGYIPGDSSKSTRIIDTLVKVVGTFAAGLAGWFWLLSETDNRPGPYLLAVVPTIAIMTIGSGINILLASASGHAGGRGAETRSRDLSPKSFIVAMLLAAGVFTAMYVAARFLI